MQYLEATRCALDTINVKGGDHVLRPYFTGRREDYTLELEDHASVTTRDYVAKGDTITMEQAGKQQRMHVAGNGYLQMPVDTFNKMRLSRHPVHRLGQAPDKTNPIKIHADQYTFADGKGAFTGKFMWNGTTPR